MQTLGIGGTGRRVFLTSPLPHSFGSYADERACLWSHGEQRPPYVTWCARSAARRGAVVRGGLHELRGEPVRAPQRPAPAPRASLSTSTADCASSASSARGGKQRHAQARGRMQTRRSRTQDRRHPMIQSCSMRPERPSSMYTLVVSDLS